MTKKDKGTLRQYEYKVLKFNCNKLNNRSQLEDQLVDLGAKGWRIVATFPCDQGNITLIIIERSLPD
jgi:hypothetical protein